ncbi:MAG: Tol-Pal system protein TolB [Parachlamydiaceae bacterium]|nr:Tol-Pal system protein TolB [Parachlamydiaceae bacterium]
MFYWIIIFLLSATIPETAYSDARDETPLLVNLSTEQKLQPLFLSQFIDLNSGLTSAYIDKLEQVLQFDLGHSGHFQLLSPTRERTSLAINKALNDPGISREWKGLNALYVVKIQIREKQLEASLLSVNANSLKTFEGFTLSGEISQDRQQLHQLADALIKSLFGTPGIASTHILFTRKYRIEALNKWNSELWECDYDGANARKVMDDQSGYCVTPIYIPPKPGYQSSMFFYVSYKKGQPKIYLGSLVSGEGQQLTQLRGNQLMPAISPQRDKIAFISDITGNPDLFLQDFSPEKGPLGKPRQIFTTHQATQGSPTFSPDGKKIAFVSNKDGSPRIYVLDIPLPETKLKDIKARLISRINRESSAPCWSPDGTKLAFCARTGDARQIWIYDFQNDEEWQLTENGGNKENPSWAPDSLHLVYNSTGQQNAELFLINLNDPRAIKILEELRGEKRFPSWEPR